MRGTTSSLSSSASVMSSNVLVRLSVVSVGVVGVVVVVAVAVDTFTSIAGATFEIDFLNMGPSLEQMDFDRVSELDPVILMRLVARSSDVRSSAVVVMVVVVD
jgi:hypothetical protein